METYLKPPSPSPSSPLTELSASPLSALSALSRTPSLSHSNPDLVSSMPSTSAPADYPSPISSGTPPASQTPLKRVADMSEAGAIEVRTDEPPAKRRRIRAPARPRTTKHIDLDQSVAEEQGDEHLQRLLQALRRKKKIVVIAGAGISVSAGIPDFRSQTGLFTTLRGGKHLFDASVYKHAASTEAFHTMVREMADMTAHATPTPFHHMLASIAKDNRLMRLYTQNVDCIDTRMDHLSTTIPLPLKPTNGWPTTIQLHGGLDNMVCTKCGDVKPFEGALFHGPEAPLCTPCQALDETRTKFAFKRSHGVGRLRPRIVLYNEYNPDEEAIGNVSKADLRKIPDAVIVVGTSMKIPGVRRLAKELCQLTRSRPNGITAWINTGPEPPGTEFKDCWDFVVRGNCDDVAELVNLPRSDSDIGAPESYDVTGDEKKRKRVEAALSRVDRFDVLLEQRPKPASVTSPLRPDLVGPPTSTDPKPSHVEQLQRGMPTPSASPRVQSPSPGSQAAKELGRPAKKSALSRSSPAPKTTQTLLKPGPAKVRKTRAPRRANKTAPKPKNTLDQAFKTTKSAAAASPKVSRKEDVGHDPSTKPKENGLPGLRPTIMPTPTTMVSRESDHQSDD